MTEKRMLNLYLYLCTQMDCKHFLNEFEVKAYEKPLGYLPCPECGCSAEENGLGGHRLAERFKL